MAELTPVQVLIESMGSTKLTIGKFTTIANNDYWSSGIAGILAVVVNAESGTGMATSWTATNGTIFFKPFATNTGTANSGTALVISKSM